jgi:hypothetical protein
VTSRLVKLSGSYRWHFTMCQSSGFHISENPVHTKVYSYQTTINNDVSFQAIISAH